MCCVKLVLKPNISNECYIYIEGIHSNVGQKCIPSVECISSEETRYI